MFEPITKKRLSRSRWGTCRLVAGWFVFILMGEIVLSPGAAHAIMTQNHDKYCSCGMKCRREKCCCKSESAGTDRPAKSLEVKATGLNKLFCLITSPCSEPPASSDVRAARVLLSTAAILVSCKGVEPDSRPLLMENLHTALAKGFLLQVDRPPEVLFS